MKATNIEWTATPQPDGTLRPGFSANPLKYRDAAGKVVWGCVKHSSGCAHCYSEALAVRYGRGGPFTRATMDALTPFLDEKELRQILTAKVIDKAPVAGSRFFLGDMTDVFGDWVPDALLDRLFAVMGLRPDVTFQVLTKRSERMARYYGDGHRNGRGVHTSLFIAREMSALAKQYGISSTRLDEVNGLGDHLPPNIWLGVSVENQDAADARIPHLLATPAAVRFLSCEPLLAPVALFDHSEGVLRGPAVVIAGGTTVGTADFPAEGYDTSYSGIDWVIIGGESGPGARGMQIEWARSLVAQCKAADVPAFVKQLGAKPTGDYYRDRDEYESGRGVEWPDPLGWSPHDGQPAIGSRVTLPILDRKGGELAEWPADLQVRQFPEAPA